MLRAQRIVAAASAIDRLVETRIAPGALVLRISPDEAIVVGSPAGPVDDAHAIVEDESGLSVIRFSAQAFDEKVRPHIEWEVPRDRPASAQGLVAAVPCKVWLDTEVVLVICATAVIDELAQRLR